MLLTVILCILVANWYHARKCETGIALVLAVYRNGIIVVS